LALRAGDARARGGDRRVGHVGFDFCRGGDPFTFFNC
jgi:hypothetical protein